MTVVPIPPAARRRALLVVNPASRLGRRYHRIALAAFKAAGVRCDAVLTEHQGQGAEIAHSLAPRYDMVFTLGGDGTAMEVVGALAGTGRPVGILPGGTGNLIARTLGIPLNIRRAVAVLLTGEEARVDLGKLSVGGRHFAFAAGVGVDASMIAEASSELKRRIGVLAYVFSWSRAAFRRDLFRVRITVDGEVVEKEATAVMIANFGAVLNDLMTLGPGIRPDDAKLDLCVFSPYTVRDAIRIAWKLLRKDFTADPSMFYRAGRQFRIETLPPRVAQADGELLGMTPFEVAVAPLAAQLLIPRRT
ncbi:MAG TPA: diacylglycerol kinase family protein [Gemmatimonadaceae bacterium]|nr:diacylglycerol kinase family protein [Gemmatimonadaceae bacterium]